MYHDQAKLHYGDGISNTAKVVATLSFNAKMDLAKFGV